MVVIKIGRKRSKQACLIASSGGMPSLRSALMAKSTIMMPFFLTMPISSRMPISAISENSVLASISISSAPTPAENTVERMVIGRM